MAESTKLAVVSVNNLIVRHGTQTILDGATITILEGERVGLVGRNGSGKSTFLQIAAGAASPDSGDVALRRDLVTGYMPQVFDLDESATVHANILSGAQRILDLIAEYEVTPPESAQSGLLLEQISHADGWNLEHRIKSLITNLHAPDEERIVGTLSGGEKRRVALCRALLPRPDFLLLDEPTNHLDTGSIEWLEDFLARYAGTCLFVTHDRYFLDRVATRIVELARGQFSSYDGTYTDYLLARAQRQAVEEMQERKRQKFLKRELEWVRRGPRARRTKSVDRIERYFELAAQEAPEPELDVDLIIPPAPKLANRVIELREVTLEIGGRILFRDLSLQLQAGERLGIVGRNGLGKSSLLKLMLGQLEPARGEVEIGARTEINYVDQDRLLLDDEKTVWEEVSDGSEVGEARRGEHHPARLFAAISLQRRSDQHAHRAVQRRGTQPCSAGQNPEARRQRSCSWTSRRTISISARSGCSRRRWSRSAVASSWSVTIAIFSIAFALPSSPSKRAARSIITSGITIAIWRCAASRSTAAPEKPAPAQPPPSIAAEAAEIEIQRGAGTGDDRGRHSRARKRKSRAWKRLSPRLIFIFRRKSSGARSKQNWRRRGAK